jgi:hypothetical protein
LSGSTFFPNLNRMLVSVAGDSALFNIDPYADMVVAERVMITGTVSFWGTSNASVGGPRISASFVGRVEYCPDTFGPQNTFPYLRCAEPVVDCDSANHRLTLVRR